MTKKKWIWKWDYEKYLNKKDKEKRNKEQIRKINEKMVNLNITWSIILNINCLNAPLRWRKCSVKLKNNIVQYAIQETHLI